MIILEHIYLKKGGKVLFNDFNLQIKKGEHLLIRGPSGSGKSTLLKMILGFVQADAGQISINGELLNSRTIWPLRQRMAYVSQDLEIGSGKVKDTILEIFDYRGNQHLRYDETKTLALFQQFKLEPAKLQQKIEDLSGGEKQRITLIIALLLNREIYLFDEITSAIDEALRQTVIQFLAHIREKTMIVVSHNQGWEEVDFQVLELPGR